VKDSLDDDLFLGIRDDGIFKSSADNTEESDMSISAIANQAKNEKEEA
jgi:hypothetical protein